jgi:hypothetical protein
VKKVPEIEVFQDYELDQVSTLESGAFARVIHYNHQSGDNSIPEDG